MLGITVALGVTGTSPALRTSLESVAAGLRSGAVYPLPHNVVATRGRSADAAFLLLRLEHDRLRSAQPVAATTG